MKRVAYLTNRYPVVSHTFVRREIQALEKSGYSVLRFTIRPTRENLPDPEDQAELGKTHAVYAPARWPCALATAAVTRPLAFVRAARLTWQLMRNAGGGWVRHIAYLAEAAYLVSILRREKIEHLHAHFGTNSASVAMLSHALGGPPFSFTVHGPDEFDRPEQESIGLKIHHACLTIAISSFGRSQLQRWCAPESWHKIQVVHCGLTDSFLAKPVEPIPTDRRLVCIGRLAPQKGHYVLLDAIRQLKDKIPPFEVVLVGDGPLRAGLEATARRYGISDFLVFAGWQSEQQIQTWLERSRAFVLPSSAEGLPVAIMEALALGRPVVSTFIAGIPELILDQQHGWLIPAGDSERLAAALHDLLSASLERLAAMGEAGKQRVSERHSIATEAARLAHWLESPPQPT